METASSDLELGQVKECTVSQVVTLAFAAFAFSPLSLGQGAEARQFHSVPFSRNTVRRKRATEGRLNFFQLLFTLGVPLQCLAIRLRRGLFGHGCRDGFLQKLLCLTMTGKILLDISSGGFGELLFFIDVAAFSLHSIKILYSSFSLYFF